ncbi:MAG: low molecular weight phosphotyrosine protein phosphatase [Burkholderiales bacterium]|nr:low molecular weight phosphotyrosine protein phosphatase [Burkholderiales bacterium]
MQKISVLFVCMGNICRSPSAEGVMRRLVLEAGLGDEVVIDSAGTHGYHLGHAPDPRSQAAAAARGYDLAALRSRLVTDEDFQRFDWLLAMDADNLAELRARCPAAQHHKLALLMRFASKHGADHVPDPYYGAAQDFEQVLDYVEDACAGLLVHLRERLHADS